MRTPSKTIQPEKGRVLYPMYNAGPCGGCQYTSHCRDTGASCSMYRAYAPNGIGFLKKPQVPDDLLEKAQKAVAEMERRKAVKAALAAAEAMIKASKEAKAEEGSGHGHES